MKKSIYTISFLLTLSIATSAQSFESHLFGSFGMAFLNNKSYNRFLETYSYYTKPDDVKRQKSTFKYGYEVGAEFSYDEKLNFRISYLKYSGMNQKFEFKEGSRNFSYNYSCVKTVTSLKFGKDNNKNSKFLGIIIGMGNTAVESYFLYPNGTKSMASEKDLNGIFDQFTSELGIEYRLQRAINDKFMIYMSCSLGYTMFITELEYHSYLRSISSNFPLENLPEEYETYMQTGNAYDYDSEYVKPNALKFDMQMGLIYKLNLKR